MKKIRNIQFIVIASLLLVTTGCNKESYIESVGKVLLDSGDNSAVGHYIFTSLASGIKCGEVTVYIDDIVIGRIKKENSKNIDCKTAPVDDVILRAVTGTGSHRIVVKFKDECRKDILMTHSIEQGKCQWFYIQ